MSNLSIEKTILSGLSDRQIEAVTYTDGPLLLIAGPGSGKTRVMAHRLAYLVGVKEIRANNILAVTFTNKAARELKDRCERLVTTEKELLQVRTFHGFCARVLRFDGGYVGLSRDFSILDDDDQKRVIKRSFEDENIDIKQYTPSKVISVISRLKNSLVTPENFANQISDYGEEIISRIYSRYQIIIENSNGVDFDDLLLKTHKLFSENQTVLDQYSERFKYIQIDEFQDTNPLQFKISKLLANYNRNICVVGDPDQSIYSWRYADPSNLTDFKKSFKETTIITLDESYRSTENILNAANSLIKNNPSRSEKNLWTKNGTGEKIILYETSSEEDEALIVLNEIQRLNKSKKISLNEIAIMYRVNAQSRVFEVTCNRLGIKYKLIGGVKFYERQEVKDILAYLRTVNNKSDDAAILRIINTPRRGISDKTVSELVSLSKLHNICIFEIIQEICSGNINTSLTPRALKSIEEFNRLLIDIMAISEQMDITDLINYVIEKIEYRSYLRRDQERGDDRLENINELIASADQYIGLDSEIQLTSFLENLALVSNVDYLESGDSLQTQGEELTLITLHQAKGLEYEAVFLVGCEDGLLPHIMSIGEPDALEEERRICYVGITRAKNQLYFSYSSIRRFRGVMGGQMLSRFISEIPKELLIRNKGYDVHKNPLAKENISGKKSFFSNISKSSSKKPQKKFNYSKGAKVKHDIFGDGIVTTSELEGGEVLFKNFGVKKLVWNYAPMSLYEHETEIDFVDPEIDSP